MASQGSRDSRARRLGATVTLLAHLVGHVISFFLVLGGLSVFALVTGAGPGGPLAVVRAIVVPPYVVVGFLLAWLVPGSFPRRRGLVLDAARWVWPRLVGLGQRAAAAIAR